MFTIHSKVPYDPHLLELPGELDERLRQYLVRLGDVLREHAIAINGDDTWDDWIIPSVSIRSPASSAPTFNDDTLTWDFSSSANNTLGLVIELPHSWKEGTNLKFHMHVYLVTAPSTNNTSRWKMDWVIYSPEGAAIPDLTVPGNWNTQSYTHTHVAGALTSDMIKFPAITTIGNVISSILKVKITRLPTDAADTVAQVVKLDVAGCHIRIDSSGSRREYVK